MIELNLKTNNEAEKLIKEYLEKNVSEELANKINNGVYITKDNKTLINKKDLKGFMDFAHNEASKLNTNKERVLAISKDTVFGWAIHYFEEDSIEGKLFNEDGTEYKAVTKVSKPSPTPKIVKPKQEENKQATLFDLMDFSTTPKEEIKETVEKVEVKEQQQDIELVEEQPIEFDDIEDTDNDFTEEEFDKALDSVAEEMEADRNYQIDKETGEVLQPINTFDKETMKMLYTILDGKITIK